MTSRAPSAILPSVERGSSCDHVTRGADANSTLRGLPSTDVPHCVHAQQKVTYILCIIMWSNCLDLTHYSKRNNGRLDIIRQKIYPSRTLSGHEIINNILCPAVPSQELPTLPLPVWARHNQRASDHAFQGNNRQPPHHERSPHGLFNYTTKARMGQQDRTFTGALSPSLPRRGLSAPFF
jgi:hypothetical protein